MQSNWDFRRCFVPLSCLLTLSLSQRDNPFGNPNFGTSREISNSLGNPNFGPQQEEVNFGNQGFVPNNRDFNNFGNSRDVPLFPVTPRNLNNFITVGPSRNFGPINQNPRQDFGDGYPFVSPEEKECPKGWDTFRQSCYRFVRSPIHKLEDARWNCQVILMTVQTTVDWDSNEIGVKFIGLWEWR